MEAVTENDAFFNIYERFIISDAQRGAQFGAIVKFIRCAPPPPCTL